MGILPNAAKAVIDSAKVRDYLLSSSHPIGRFKQPFFAALGYSRDQWQQLEADLLELAVSTVGTLCSSCIHSTSKQTT